jgi:hypothetical protein
MLVKFLSERKAWVEQLTNVIDQIVKSRYEHGGPSVTSPAPFMESVRNVDGMASKAMIAYLLSTLDNYHRLGCRRDGQGGNT